ncbi:MAG TPA: elongation factor G [Desulfonatronum sp.]|nr:elongation factor G [Desulfonatronum sp.]
MTKNIADNPISTLRNIGIIAHIDAGKTTVTERILFFSGIIHRMGEVHEGSATMDYLPEEQERGITISSACTTTPWANHILNIIDTPGHVDFTIEVERSLRVLDGAVGIFCAVGGVEPQSETVWRQSMKFGVPKLAFVNKMDRLGADFAAVLEDMRAKLNITPLPLQIPHGQGRDFKGVIDLLEMQYLVFDAETQGAQWRRLPLDESQRKVAAPWREKTLELLAEQDDAFLEKYLSGQPIAGADLHRVIRRTTLDQTLVPVMTGSALKNIGIQPLMDAVCQYLPSPADKPPIMAEDPGNRKKISLSADAGEPLAALVFKIDVESGRRLAFARIYSGSIAEGDLLYNVSQNLDERAAHIYRMHADRKQRLEQASAGQIITISGCKSTKTGDTLARRDRPLLLEQIADYQPVISLALEPKSQADAKRLNEVLEFFQFQDPTLRVMLDPETDQLILSGMGELHLEVVLERMRREYGVAPRVGNPQVLHQETVTQPGIGEAVFHRELAKTMHFGEVRLGVKPRKRGAGQSIRWTMDVQGWPDVWIQAVNQGIDDGLQSGVLKGYPVRDVLVEVEHLGRREGESSSVGYQMAAAQALKTALTSGAPQLLEPIMDIEISVPEENVGEVIGLFNAKGGRVENMFDRAGAKIITGVAPMRQLFGFSTSLRSASQGRAAFTMRFSRFDVLA